MYTINNMDKYNQGDIIRLYSVMVAHIMVFP